MNAAHQLQQMLRTMFQFDDADLDFGIYRMMNQKRVAIEQFISTLPTKIEDQMRSYSSTDQALLNQELEQKRAEIVTNLGPGAFDDHGAVQTMFAGVQLVQSFMQLRERHASVAAESSSVEAVYNDVLTFLGRYYDNGDFITQRRFGSTHSYVLPYNGEEVLLHFANRDQYYVKTGERFSAYQWTVTGSEGSVYTVRFAVDSAQVAANNNKSARQFWVLRDEQAVEYAPDSRTLTVYFAYRPLREGESEGGNAQTQQERLLREAVETILESAPAPLVVALNEAESAGESSRLLKHLRRYTRRRSSDYFVHKDLRRFLNAELDVFIKHQLVRLDEWEQASDVQLARLSNRLRTMRGVCRTVIDFLAQVEDLQRRLFEKPKFVLRCDWLITLDQVPAALLPTIAANQRQLAAWRSWYGFPLAGEVVDGAWLDQHPTVLVDTSLFDQPTVDALLAAIPDLAAATTGTLINSENWQALRSLRPTFAKQIKCIYIDPPYNTGNDGFLYKDRYQHSSWLAMMEDRLRAAAELLRDDGVIFVSINDIEQPNLRILMDTIFGEEKYIATFIWKSRHNVDSRDKTGISNDHEYVLVYGNGIQGKAKDLNKYSNPDNDPRGDWMSDNLVGLATKDKRPNLHYDLIDPKTGINYGCSEKGWRYERSSMEKKIIENRILWPKSPEGRPRHKKFQNDLQSDYTGFSTLLNVPNTSAGTQEIRGLFGSELFGFPKPEGLIRELVEQASSPDDLILDFFAGSGTTAHAVMSLNRADGGRRRFVLIEMGAYFDSVLKPRVIKAAYSAEWKNGLPGAPAGERHLIRVERLESYEDALNNIVFDPKLSQAALAVFQGEHRDDYTIRYMLELESRASATLLDTAQLSNPSHYTLLASDGDGGTPAPTVVDLPATFTYLMGITVHSVRVHINHGRRYLEQRGTLPDGSAVVIIWRDMAGLDLEDDERFILATIPLEDAQVYINGASYLADADVLDPVFRTKMGRR